MFLEPKTPEMVTKWCLNEDLRMYLQNHQEQTDAGEISLDKMAIDILEGLVYLEKQTVRMCLLVPSGISIALISSKVLNMTTKEYF